MFPIDYKSRTPLYQQIIDNVQRLAAAGILTPDSQLPSVRQLAVDLSLNPNTVSRAYSELEMRGVIYSLPGRGNFIAANSEIIRSAARSQALSRLTELAREVYSFNTDRQGWLALADNAWAHMESEKGGDNK